MATIKITVELKADIVHDLAHIVSRGDVPITVDGLVTEALEYYLRGKKPKLINVSESIKQTIHKVDIKM